MKKYLLALAVVISFAANSANAGLFGSVTSGGGDSDPVSGTAVSKGDGNTTSSTGSSGLNRCGSNHGRIAIEENQMNGHVLSSLGLPSSAPLARHAVLQSGCFTVVNRSTGYAMGEQERQIRGEMGGSTRRKTSTARWSLNVEIPQPTTQTGGGVGGLLGMLPIGVAAPVLGMIAGSVSFSEATVMLTVTDLETSEIVASVTGTGKSTDVGLGGALVGGLGGAAGGAWGKSPSGKVVAAAFVDAINQLVPLMDEIAEATPAPEAAPVAVSEVTQTSLATKGRTARK